MRRNANAIKVTFDPHVASDPQNEIAYEFWDGAVTVTNSASQTWVDANFTYTQDDIAARHGIKNARQLRTLQKSLGRPSVWCPPPCVYCGDDVDVEIPPTESRAEFTRFVRAAWAAAACPPCSEKYAAEKAVAEGARLAEAAAKRQRLRERFGSQYVNDCPACEGVLIFRKGRNGGLFISCSSWPGCKHTEPIVAAPVPRLGEEEIAKARAQMAAATPCPSCGNGRLMRRHGKYGEFLGCSSYPECRYTEQVQEEAPTRADAPVADAKLGRCSVEGCAGKACPSGTGRCSRCDYAFTPSGQKPQPPTGSESLTPRIDVVDEMTVKDGKYLVN